MTLEILNNRVMRLLKKGDFGRDREWDMRDIEYLLRDACAKIAKDSWYEARNSGDKNISSVYVTTFTVPVKEDEAGNNYCDIPVDSWVMLPDEMGIQSVRPDPLTTGTRKTKDDELQAFVPVPNRFRDIFGALPAGAVEGLWTYQIRKKKIYFSTKYDQTLLFNDIENVDIDLISFDASAIALTDALPIPEEKTGELIISVLQVLGMPQNQIKDLTNNENPSR